MNLSVIKMQAARALEHIHEGKDFSQDVKIVSSDSNYIRTCIMVLFDLGVPYRLQHLGAGLKVLTSDTNICPKCQGTGRV